jgi:pilus assembly protein CpaF
LAARTASFHLQLKTLDGVLDEQVPLVEDAYTLGRDTGCDIVLRRPTISKRHAEIRRKGATYEIADLGSTVGVFVNDQKITSTILQPGDRLILGDVLVIFCVEEKSSRSSRVANGVEAGGGVRPSAEGTMKIETMALEPMRSKSDRTDEGTKVKHGPPRIGRQSGDENYSPFASHHEKKGARKDTYTQLRAQIHEQLIDAIRIRRNSLETLEDKELWAKARVMANQIIFDLQQHGKLPRNVDPQTLLKDVLSEALGLGPIQDFLADPEVEEIMVNGPDNIFIARRGKTIRTDKVYIDEERLETVINRIVAPLGRQINKLTPMVDARLADGSRVNAIIAPLSRSGPVLTIRKFPPTPLSPEQLVKSGSMSPAMLKFFRLAVENRLNVLISGATAAGKTTLLNVLSSFIPAEERIITIEDSAELQIPQPHVISLETRPGNAEGTPEITIRDLVRNSLRMRPQRIIVGECRGGEAVDMLQAMNTGHDGSLTTGHANGPREMLSRLETMCLMAGIEMPLPAIREQISRAINLIIQVERFPDGKRRITSVAEILGLDDGEYDMKEVYRFECTSVADGSVQGRYLPCGYIPAFIARLKETGVDVPLEIFQAD